jgi:2-isopropylmalate synthase
VAYCKSQGREVFYDAEHFFDGYRANPEYALKTLQAAANAGATTVILCDTNGGTLPERIAEVVQHVKRELSGEGRKGFEGEPAGGSCAIGIHCHNDCELAVANSLAAVRAGASQVQGTMNGIGERCGNVDLVSVIANLALKYGYDVLSPGSLTRLTETSRYVYELANLNFRNGQPFVGLSAFAHKGGMHTHAVAKDPATYEHINPELVGNERRILVSELSGHSTILTKTAKYELNHDKALMTKILNAVQDLENQGYEFEAAEASFDLLVRKVAKAHKPWEVDKKLKLYKPWFERISYRVNIEARENGTPVTEGTVRLKVRDEIEHTASEGDGPVNALDGALRKALIRFYPRLGEMQLVDYKVRVVNPRAGTAARVRVVIESRDHTDIWGTVGVSENIIEASWLALVDSIEFKLFKDEEQGRR